MQLSALAELSGALSGMRRRSARVEAIAALLSRTPGHLVETVTAWLSGELLGPPLGVGPAALEAACAELGAPAEASALTVQGVITSLGAIAAIAGKGSKVRRQAALVALLEAGTEPERGFLVGLLGGGLRQGALEGLVLQGVARTFEADEAALRRAVMLRGGLPPVAAALATEGAACLPRFTLEVMRPVLPMLADTAPDLHALLPARDRLLVEAKLDGARVQIHRRGDEVRIFTRALHDITHALPEVVGAVRALPCAEVILDGEVLALSRDGRPAPFQTTMRRVGRSARVAEAADAVPLTPFVFDLLLLDGAPLIDRPLSARREALENLLGREPTLLRPSPAVRAPSAEDLEAFYEEVLAAGHEGLMAKALDSPWEAGSRGAAWQKLKPAHTLDLVVIAVEEGSGRRAGLLSNLHLAARNTDPAGPPFVMLGKTFKGLTDATLAWQTEALGARATHREGHIVHVRPELVVEIAFQDLIESDRYPGGLSLRFARVRRYRDDKGPESADTLEAVRTLAGR